MGRLWVVFFPLGFSLGWSQGGWGLGENFLTWDIVYIATIHEEMAILGVAERR